MKKRRKGSALALCELTCEEICEWEPQRESVHEWCLWQANLLRLPVYFVEVKKSFLRYSSRLISSIRLSGCLYVILAIRAVLFWLIVCSWGDALGTWASITLTFVLLLDIRVAQAHQSHLEAENAHFAITSTGEEKEKKTVTILEWSQVTVYCVMIMYLYISWTLVGGTKCGGITWVKAVQYRSVQQCEIVLEHIQRT